MSIRLMAKVFEQSKMTHGARLTMLAIADNANDKGEAFPSVATIAAKSRISERAVQRALKECEEAGELKVLKNAGPRGCHLFRITLGEGDKTTPIETHFSPLNGVTKRHPSTGDKTTPGDILTGATKLVEGGRQNVQKGGDNLSPEPSVEPSKNRHVAKKANEPSEKGLSFAAWFRTMVPEDQKPVGNWMVQWAVVYDAMVRIDGRTDKEIARVCEWARHDEFWGGNFFTPCKLRKRNGDGVLFWDVFKARMGKSPKPNGHTNAYREKHPTGAYTVVETVYPDPEKILADRQAQEDREEEEARRLQEGSEADLFTDGGQPL